MRKFYMSEKLIEKRCIPCEGGVPKLSIDDAKELLKKLDKDWALSSDGQRITRKFRFKNFDKVMSFVNAIAWIAEREQHHPDIELGYDYCNVNFFTHAIQGLSENDFICAAKIDALFKI